MWPKILNSKWFERLFTASIAILGILLTQALISGRESSANIKDEFDKRPTTEQVQLQFNEMTDYVNKQDDNITNTLQQHIDESNRSNEAVMKYIMSIDGNVKVILNNQK